MKKFKIDMLETVEIGKKKLFKSTSQDFFRNEQLVAEALSQAILDGDKAAFHDIFAGMLSVINKEELARRSNVPIATIRRMAAGSNFNVDSLLKITAAVKKAS